MKIYNRKNKIIFEDKYSTIRKTVKNAVRQNIDLSYADLSNTDLNNTDLSYANLYNANLFNANLEGVNLINIHLYGTNLNKAKLRSIDLENLFKSLDKNYLYYYNYIIQQILNHPNCPLKFKIMNLLS